MFKFQTMADGSAVQSQNDPIATRIMMAIIPDRVASSLSPIHSRYSHAVIYQ
ncbi:MAG: hypothetical protein ACE5GZ_14070 [Gammaproteobacteria bacterium]